MVSKILLSSAALFMGAHAAYDLKYDWVPVIETGISMQVECRGSDSGTCNNQSGLQPINAFFPSRDKPAEECLVTLDDLNAATTIEQTCLSEVGAVYPDEDMSDILKITVTIPATAAADVGLSSGADVPTPDATLTKVQLRLCFTPKFSTNKRAWRTNDSKDDKNRVKRDKSCAKIVKTDDEKFQTLDMGKTNEDGSIEFTFSYTIPQTTPIALMYPQVRYLCDDSEGTGFDEYKTPTNNVCGYFPKRGEASQPSFRTRPISVNNLSRIQGPLIALMFVAPLFLGIYFLKDMVFRSD